MSEPKRSAVMSVPFDVYEIKSMPPIQDGFYFNIPVDDAEKINPAEIIVSGPFETAQEAREAAAAFIKDALTDHHEATPHNTEKDRQ